MPPNPPETAPGFWRCRACGTPNPRAGYLTKCLGCGRPIPPESPEIAREISEPAGGAEEVPIRGRRTLALAAIFGLLVLVSVALIRTAALGWWAVAVLVFMPRWLFLAPLIPLAVFAVRARRRMVWALVGADLLLIVGPLMGFTLPLGRPVATPPAGAKVRIMTFNRGGVRLDAPALVRYLDRHKVDVVCFQEPGNDRGLDESLAEHGWHLDRAGRIASRFPIVGDLGRSTDVNESDFRYTMTLFRARLRHPDGFEFLVGSAHLPTPRWGLARLFAGDLRAFRLNLAWWDREADRLLRTIDEAGETPVLVAGDFNMPSDYSTMAAIRSRYPSAFEHAGWGFGYTRPTALPWVRIDHVLGSRDWSFARCWIGPDLGSDHLPLVAEAVLGR